jgi:hypothetical protein
VKLSLSFQFSLEPQIFLFQNKHLVILIGRRWRVTLEWFFSWLLRGELIRNCDWTIGIHIYFVLKGLFIILFKDINNLWEVRFDIWRLMRWNLLTVWGLRADLFKSLWNFFWRLFIRTSGWRNLAIRASVKLSLKSANSLVKLCQLLIKLEQRWDQVWIIFKSSSWTHWRLKIGVFFKKRNRWKSIWTLFLIRVMIFLIIWWWKVKRRHFKMIYWLFLI